MTKISDDLKNDLNIIKNVADKGKTLEKEATM